MARIVARRHRADDARVAPEVLCAGAPAVEKKQLSGFALRWIRNASEKYQQFRQRYMTASCVRVIDDARIA